MYVLFCYLCQFVLEGLLLPLDVVDSGLFLKAFAAFLTGLSQHLESVQVGVLELLFVV